jgi:hypothetical protein
MRSLLLIALLAASACTTQRQRDARAFVHADATSDAINAAQVECDGTIELIEGREGYGPSDYRCVRQSQSGPEPPTQAGMEAT